ncbi:MAG: MBL fold metallo-hydrolase [Calditrichaceae bacterium]
MSSITFLGAVGTVTGSRFLLEVDGQKNLIDCGMFQGPKKNRLKNWEPFPVNPAEIERILLTHAHIDHSGYIPRFCRDKFKGVINSTYETKALCDIMLRDSAHIQEEDARWANKKGFSKHKPALPLYTIEDAENALSFFKPYHYGEEFYLNDTVRIKFKDAGHILGSAFIDIKRLNGRQSKKILFSGDFGRPDRPVLREPVQVYNVNYLILESTYGDRLHEESEPYEDLARVINEAVRRRGVIVIPAFAVGRTQTLLFTLRELEEDGKIPELPIYIDSPMAIATTKVFDEQKRGFNLTARKQLLEGKKIFSPKNLHICQSVTESKAINAVKEKAIIISSSGMATAGRILHHLSARLPERQNTVLLIGYQAEGTRGRSILEGKPIVKIHGQQVPVRAKIESISGFSGHGDYSEILAWLMAFNKPPEKTFIVHGEQSASEAMAEHIKNYFGWNVILPEYGRTYDLDF